MVESVAEQWLLVFKTVKPRKVCKTNTNYLTSLDLKFMSGVEKLFSVFVYANKWVTRDDNCFFKS